MCRPPSCPSLSISPLLTCGLLVPEPPSSWFVRRAHSTMECRTADPHHSATTSSDNTHSHLPRSNTSNTTQHNEAEEWTDSVAASLVTTDHSCIHQPTNQSINSVLTFHSLRGVVLCCVVLCVQLMYGGTTDQAPQNDVWATTNGRQWYWVAGYSDGVAHPYGNERYAETFPTWGDAATCQVSTATLPSSTTLLTAARRRGTQ